MLFIPNETGLATFHDKLCLGLKRRNTTKQTTTTNTQKIVKQGNQT